MLLHIRPQIYCLYEPVALVDLTLEPFGLLLLGGKDLTARHPYPNKRYFVACRKRGQRAIDGILIETAGRVSEFDCTTRWLIGPDFIATHRVHYTLADDKHDATSDSSFLWHQHTRRIDGEMGGDWPRRFPPSYDPNARRNDPKMVLDDGAFGCVFGAAPRIVATDAGDRVVLWAKERNETCELPTLERERVLTTWLHSGRGPTLDSAFRIAGARPSG